MKNFTNNFKQFTSRLSARWLIMALMLLLGTSSAWAQNYNYHWKGKVYFVAPETWDLTNYAYVQVNITRTTSKTTSNHQEYVGSMTRLGTSRMYYLQLDANHSNWGQNEYLAFTANDHTYNSGSFALSGNHYYTKPIDYDCNNSDNYYLFKPDAEDNYNTVTGAWGANRDILKAAQTVQICTNGNSSASGGKVTLKGYYFSADNAITQSTATSTSATETYNGAVIGSEMTLTASANTGYEFDGWYNEASGGTLLSSSATYTYNVYEAKTIYARFTQSCNTATLSWANTFNGSMKVGDDVTNPASLDNAAAASSISYTSSNSEVISVNGTTLTALKSGTATITASATPNTGFCSIESIEKDVTVTCDVVNTEDIKIEVVCTSGDTPYIWAWEPDNNNNNLTGGNWPGQAMTPKGNNIYSWETKPTSGKSVSIIISKNENGANQTNDIDGLQIGKRYKFSYDPNTTVSGSNDRYVYQLLEEDCLAPACTTPDFSVQLSNATVTKGDENIIASITGTDSPAVTWSSSETSVATIDADGNITAIKEGQTNITATTTGDDGFCGGVEKTATLTVKSPITTVTLEHANSDGTLKAETPTYCVGDVVYFKLTHGGSPFSEYDWTTYPGSGLAGYCSNGSGLYHFTLTGSGTIGISLRNEANVDLEGNPTWVESNLLWFNTHPEPTAPYISIDPASGVICQGSSATIKVENPSKDCSYKLVEEGSKAGFEPYKSGDLKYTVQNVAKYYVVAQHNACTANEYTSNQVAINQIISTNANISIDPDKAKTTPWEPVTITVKPDAGYIYELTYTDNNLAGVNGVRIKQNGDSYTYYIPRPDSWGTGDSDSDPDPNRTPINYVIQAQLKVDGEESTCKLNAATATIQLNDEDNEDCHQ